MKPLYYLIITTMLLLIAACWQQQQPAAHSRADSLIQAPGFHRQEGKETSDTTLIKELIQIGNAIKARFPDSALHLYQEALAISYQTNCARGAAPALINIGYYYYNEQPDYPRARSLFKKALLCSQSPSVTNRKLFPQAQLAIGNTWFREGRFDSASYSFFRALATIQAMRPPDTGLLASAYLAIGAATQYLDTNYTRAIQYSRKAEQLFLATREKDTFQLINIKQNIGSLYTWLGKYDSALTAFKGMLELARPRQIPKEMLLAYSFVGAGYLEMGEYVKGGAYLDSAANSDQKDATTNMQLLQKRGAVYFLSGQFIKAIPYFKRSLLLPDEKTGLLYSYTTLARIYDTLGQWRQAAYYLKASMSLKDSLMSEEKIRTINQLEIKYKSIEKDRQLARKDLEIVKAQGQIQRKTATTWIAILCTLLLASVMVLLRYHQSNKLRKLQQEKKLELLKASMAGEATERIRVGRELHDGIGGLLSAIKLNLVSLRLKRADIAAEQNFITTIELADQAATELRETAHNLVPSDLIKNGLFRTIQAFCLRLSASATTSMEVTETGLSKKLDAAHELVIYRIVQELAHNILKHSGATRGQISLSWQERVLLVTVEDNGAGIMNDKDHDGIGMENIHKGIERLNGSIEIDSIPGEGTSVYLEFPI